MTDARAFSYPRRLIRKYGTRDPFTIAEEEGVNLLFELVPSGVEFEEGGTKKKGDNTVRICYSIADNTRKQIGRNCHHEYSIPQEFRERQGSNWVN